MADDANKTLDRVLAQINRDIDRITSSTEITRDDASRLVKYAQALETIRKAKKYSDDNARNLPQDQLVQEGKAALRYLKDNGLLPKETPRKRVTRNDPDTSTDDQTDS